MHLARADWLFLQSTFEQHSASFTTNSEGNSQHPTQHHQKKKKKGQSKAKLRHKISNVKDSTNASWPRGPQCGASGAAAAPSATTKPNQRPHTHTHTHTHTRTQAQASNKRKRASEQQAQATNKQGSELATERQQTPSVTCVGGCVVGGAYLESALDVLDLVEAVEAGLLRADLLQVVVVLLDALVELLAVVAVGAAQDFDLDAAVQRLVLEQREDAGVAEVAAVLLKARLHVLDPVAEKVHFGSAGEVVLVDGTQLSGGGKGQRRGGEGGERELHG